MKRRTLVRIGALIGLVSLVLSALLPALSAY
jgi:hypothetical protein